MPGQFASAVMTIAKSLLISLAIVVLGVAARADAGGRVYTANMESGTISVVDPDSMKVIATIDARGHRTRGLSFTPDQTRLFVTNMHNGTLTVVDTATHEVVATIATGRLAHAASVTPDGKQVWVVNGAEEYLTVVDVASLKIVGRVSLGEIIGSGYVWFSPDGARAYVTSPPRGALVVVDVTSKKVLKTVEVGKGPTFIQAASDGRRLWGTDTGGDEIYVVDASTNTVLGKLTVGMAPEHLAIIGERLYVTIGAGDEIAVVADNGEGQVAVTGRIKVGGRPRGIWPSPDGGRLYVAREALNDLAVIDVRTQKVIGTVPVGRRPVAVVAAR